MAHAQLPSSYECEKAVLAACILYPSVMLICIDVLTEADFDKKEHKTVFNAFIEITKKNNRAPDAVEVVAYLEREGLSDIGMSLAAMSRLDESLPNKFQIDNYTAILKDLTARRSAIIAANELIVKSYASEGNASDIIEGSISTLKDVSVKSHAASPYLVHAKEAFDGLNSRLQNSSKKDILGLSTGIPILDSMTLGLCKGNLVTISAETGCGKTTFAKSIAWKNALAGKSVSIFSYEMTAEEIANVMIADMTGISHARIRQNYLTPGEKSQIEIASDAIRRSKLFIDDSCKATFGGLIASLRRQKAVNGLDLAVIDHLQICPHPSGKTDLERISAATRGFKLISQELEIPLILISQLRRVEFKDNEGKLVTREPELSDLRGSGTIEQDSNLVIFLYFNGNHMSAFPPEITGTCLLKKNRAGSTGVIEIKFDRPAQRIISMQDKVQPEWPNYLA